MLKVLDVSHWQGAIDWRLVKADAAIMKATQSTTFIDPLFSRNQAGARAAGLLAGFYHFAGGTNPKAEAEYFVKNIGPLKQHDLLVLDWEIEHIDPVGWCLAFLNRVYELTGVRPLLYTNEERLKRLDWTRVYKGDYGLWVAKYSLFQPKTGAWPFYVLWQYTSSGSMSGVSGKVDLSRGNLTLDTLKKYGYQRAECTHSCPVHCDKQ